MIKLIPMKVKGTSCMFCGNQLTTNRGALFCDNKICIHNHKKHTDLQRTS
jgi:hypothetical protein